MRKILRLVVPALLGAAGLLGLAPSTISHAATSTVLPISSYYQMVVDPAHGHIFISQGNSSQDGILVTDLTGQVVTTITGQTGVMGIALSPDGSTLYAALRGGDAVTAIDTTTLTQIASYPLPAGDLPKDVAVQSGKIWVSFDTGTLFAAGVGFLDPSVTSRRSRRQIRYRAGQSRPSSPPILRTPGFSSRWVPAIVVQSPRTTRPLIL